MVTASLAGRLLVANPRLPDGNFDRTVVLVLAHGEQGAIGVVLNRPVEAEVGAPFEAWAALAAPPVHIFVGGPVDHTSVIGLARLAPGSAESGDGWHRAATETATVDLERDPAGLEAGIEAVRIFLGYAGWAPDQLEAEIEAEAWWVLDGHPDDFFTCQPDELWRRVLRRQRGSLALVAAYPADPLMN